ncbi:MAG: hypothetical protein MK193_02910 [Lentisphaeria bacterium]|nr:hypothetical protein [Lentisphaeria bacterium]
MKMINKYLGFLVILGICASCGDASNSDFKAAEISGGGDKEVIRFVLDASSLPHDGDFKLIDEADALTGKVLEIPGGIKTETNLPTGSIQVEVPDISAEPLHMWLRVYWTEVCSNSFTLEIPNEPPMVIGEDEVYLTWHWIKVADLELKAGQTYKLTAREDNLKVDQILFTNEPDYQPAGHEKTKETAQ